MWNTVDVNAGFTVRGADLIRFSKKFLWNSTAMIQLKDCTMYLFFPHASTAILFKWPLKAVWGSFWHYSILSVFALCLCLVPPFPHHGSWPFIFSIPCEVKVTTVLASLHWFCCMMGKCSQSVRHINMSTLLSKANKGQVIMLHFR